MDECPEDDVISVAAVDKVRELVFAEETPSSELSPLTSSFRFLEAPVRRLRGLLRVLVGESRSSPLASSGSREFLEYINCDKHKCDITLVTSLTIVTCLTLLTIVTVERS